MRYKRDIQSLVLLLCQLVSACLAIRLSRSSITALLLLLFSIGLFTFAVVVVVYCCCLFPCRVTNKIIHKNYNRSLTIRKQNKAKNKENTTTTTKTPGGQHIGIQKDLAYVIPLQCYRRICLVVLMYLCILTVPKKRKEKKKKKWRGKEKETEREVRGWRGGGDGSLTRSIY